MKEKFDLVKEWFHKAEHDIGIVELALRNDVVFTDVICYHCQQAVEKYLKGCLITLEIDFKRTHDLSYLLDLLNDHTKIEPEYFDFADILNSYAIEIRYPDDWYEPTKSEAKEAYRISKSFKLLSEDIIRAKTVNSEPAK